LSEGIEDTTNEAAQRGTDIHAQAEAMMRGEPEPFQEHAEYAQAYVDFVRSLVEPGDDLLIEQRLSFEEYAPGGFGTADAVIVPSNGGWAKIVDLKTGRGRVSAGTPQLMIYALALVQRLALGAGLQGVHVYIWQNGQVDSYTWTIDELLQAGEVVRAAAKAALDPTTKPVPGDRQCQWCKARSRCTARAVHVLEQAGEVYGLADLGTVLPVAQRLEAWSRDVQERAHNALMDGASVPGYKLVEGTSRRKWSDDAMQTVEDMGLANVLTERKLISITAAEKLLGKREARPILDVATERPPGSPVLAPRSDPRPEIGQPIVTI
jgi:hypothetical protein